MKSKILLWVIVWALAGSVRAANSIAWNSGASDIYVSDHLGLILNPQIATNTALEGDGQSALIQLIYAGPNGTADYAYAASGTIAAGVFTNGQGSDDVVVGYKWIGFGKAAASSPGRWSVSGDNVYVNDLYGGGKLFVRVWELPSARVGTGDIPTNTAGSVLYYGDSALYTSLVPDPQNPVAETFSLPGGFSTLHSLAVVPEPGSLLLMLLSGTVLAVSRLLCQPGRRW